MKRVILFLILHCSISLLLFSQTDTVYISPTGNDITGTGTSNSPYLMVTKGLSRKDTSRALEIYVMPGNYNQVVTVNRTGSFNYPIIIQAYNPTHDPSIKSVFWGNDTSAIHSSDDAIFRWNNKLDYITLDGLIIQSATANNNLRGFWMNGDHMIMLSDLEYLFKEIII
jgi:hypothetical protein